MGLDIKVETQGSVGAENVITPEDLAQAKAVIIAADTSVDKSRFAGMTIIEASAKDAIKDAKGLLTKAANVPESSTPINQVNPINAMQKESTRTGVYKHLMTGVSFMIPFVVAGGLLIALGFALGGIYVYKVPGSFAETLFSTGKAAFALMIPILGAFIAYSIADRPGLVPGMVGGYIAANNGSGFLGAMVAGFAAGYIVLGIKKYINLPKSVQGLMPILVIPVLSAAILGLLMVYIIGKPMTFFNTALSSWLTSLSGTNAAFLGIILGLMMAFDMGGPVNKAAYTFGAATVATGQPSAIMAAVMVAGMVPPLAIALSTVIAKKRYTLEELEAGKANWALGLSFITEGAIPFAAADPFRVIPSLMVGSAFAGAISMIFGSTLIVPHGGIWVLAIPHVVTNLGPYILALVVGTIVSALILSVVKRPIEEK
jgi:PTS system fructose-specific IIC component